VNARGCLLGLLAAVTCLSSAGRAIGAESPQLQISPMAVLEGDLVSIRITGLNPGSTATLHARSAETAGGGPRPYYGTATFVANADGIVDLATDAPIRGYYGDADLRGLFWSQKRLDQDAEGNAVIEALHLGPASVDPGQVVITLEQAGIQRDRKVLSLMTSHPEVVQEDVLAEGLVGRFFHRGAERGPALIVLGGAEGGLIFADLIGPQLAARGYAVLGVAYFAPRTEAIAGVPTALNRIPVELLERARNWLQARPEADVGRLGIVGASKGGEFALVLASIYDWIGAVVAFVPSDTVWQGFEYGTPEDSMGSSWSRHGVELPFLPQTGQRQEIIRGRQPGAAPIELARVSKANRAAASAQRIAAATIPIERSKAALLLIGGGDDRTGDSGASVARIARRLERSHYRFPYEALVYPAAGHAIVGSGWRPTTTHNTGVFNDGGTPEADARAQADAWTKMLGFLSQRLFKLPPPKQILERYDRALGGEAAIRKHTSAIWRGVFEARNGQQFPLAYFAHAPYLRLERVTLPDGSDLLNGFDGRIAWSVDAHQGAQISSGDERESAKRDADFYYALNELSWFRSMINAGIEVYEGQLCYHLHGLTHWGKLNDQFYDVGTGLLAGYEFEQPFPDGPKLVHEIFSDYHRIDGVLVPLRQTARTRPKEGGDWSVLRTIRYSSVTFNNVEPFVFVPPAAVLALQATSGAGVRP
jgi:dienelactone hydrolase